MIIIRLGPRGRGVNLGGSCPFNSCFRNPNGMVTRFDILSSAGRIEIQMGIFHYVDSLPVSHNVYKLIDERNPRLAMLWKVVRAFFLQMYLEDSEQVFRLNR